MTSTIERLRRLRLQAGAQMTPGAGVAGALHPSAARAPNDDVVSPARSTHVAADDPHSHALAQLRRLLHPGSRGLYPRTGSIWHGPLRGEEICPGLRYVESQQVQNEFDALLPPRWPTAVAVARERFLCFDTETTGLAGGSGTRAFMIGAADWHAGMLRVRQLYLTAMSAESAMLNEFARWLAASTVLVSYNGRSYDAPLLATRYRLQRIAYPLHDMPHVDLLHPVRRRYRGVWENCRLATIERHALRILREDDLPGAQAPAAWLNFLRCGDGTNLMRVLEHNRQDVVTLARLLEHMAEIAPTSMPLQERAGFDRVQF